MSVSTLENLLKLFIITIFFLWLGQGFSFIRFQSMFSLNYAQHNLGSEKTQISAIILTLIF